MGIILILVIVGTAVYMLRSIPHSMQWASALTVDLVLGLSMLLINLLAASRHNCGSKYDPDIGCAATVPAWTVTIGLIALAAMIVMAVSIICIFFLNRRKPT